jgi:beta-glucosidase-like glycosyl hydrolase
MNDGPQGFRGPVGTSTQWPSGLTVAQAFDREAMNAFGVGMGKEFRGKGCDVQFGPG